MLELYLYVNDNTDADSMKIKYKCLLLMLKWITGEEDAYNWIWYCAENYFECIINLGETMLNIDCVGWLHYGTCEY